MPANNEWIAGMARSYKESISIIELNNCSQIS
jgi:hypothetical protein